MCDRIEIDALIRCLLRLDVIGTNADRADGVLADAELAALLPMTVVDAEKVLPSSEWHLNEMKYGPFMALEHSDNEQFFTWSSRTQLVFGMYTGMTRDEHDAADVLFREMQGDTPEAEARRERYSA